MHKDKLNVVQSNPSSQCDCINLIDLLIQKSADKNDRQSSILRLETLVTQTQEALQSHSLNVESVHTQLRILQGLPYVVRSNTKN